MLRNHAIRAALVVGVLLAAAWLRMYRLGDLPPGWRDDEIVETTVHAGRVLAGDWPLYFPEAEGHEPLYHYLSAGWMALAGQSLLVVRLLSAWLALLALAALYALARGVFGWAAALPATAALAVSFWGLMYARFKLRHISLLTPMLLGFYFLLYAGGGPLAPAPRTAPDAAARRYGVLAGVCLAAALHTYFAARVLPVVVLAFAAYLWLAHQQLLRAHWRRLAWAGGVAGVLSLPLALAIAATPGGEARLDVVGAPLRDLLNGDPRYAARNTLETLGMFAFTGDPEYLYNIPGRPVFGPALALALAAGVGWCLRHWRQPRCAFALLWLMGGLAPAFLSTPAASLGHTIAAQPAAYVLAFAWVPSAARANWLRGGRPAQGWAVAALAAVLVALTAARDLPGYFRVWPALPEVRRLYRASLHAAAPALRQLPSGSELGLASALLHPADVAAVALEAPGRGLRPVLFNPEWAWVFVDRAVPVLLNDDEPAGLALEQAPNGEGLLPSTVVLPPPEAALEAAFANGWTLTGYSLRHAGETAALMTYWRAAPGYVPPPPRSLAVLAHTPLPLKFFAHLVSPEGAYLAGGDRLDVDPATLRAGDTFAQRFEIPLPPDLPAGRYPVQVGIYDPATGERVPLAAGGDAARLADLEHAP